MDIMELEDAAIESKTPTTAVGVRELGDYELALIGGGIGEVVFG